MSYGHFHTMTESKKPLAITKHHGKDVVTQYHVRTAPGD